MPVVSLYNQEGKEIGNVNLSEHIFGQTPKPEFLHQVVVALQANARKPIAHTKGRGEVRGGGRKPWKQKGTGRARHGSIRSPIWKGGGVTFGPTKERNFEKKINKKIRRKALAMSLSDKVLGRRMYVVDSLDFEKIKTKQASLLLQNIALWPKKINKKELSKEEETQGADISKASMEKPQKIPSILVVLPGQKEFSRKSFQNLKNVKVIHAVNLNVLDILQAQYLLLSQDAIDILYKIFGGQEQQPVAREAARKGAIH